MKAYPTTYKNYDERISTDCSGMDLRDYFAAKAMQAIIGKSDDKSIEIGEIDNWIGDYAYDVADAMMEARGRK
jgi:hypothetical protein